jgi:predicted membrane protein
VADWEGSRSGPLAEDEAPAGRREFRPRIVLGLLLMAVGALLTLDNLGLVEAKAILRLWPALLVVVGVQKVRCARRRGWGVILIVAGSWLLLERLGILHLRLRDVWPAFLVVAGVYLILQGLRPRGPRFPEPQAVSSSRVDAVAIMAGAARTSNSVDFKGGELVAVMGGCEVDLRQAAIRDAEAVIDVFAFWGGIELKVPKDWSVASTVTPVMGAFEDKTTPPKGGSTQRLLIKGLVVMGGVEVKN